MLAKRLTSNLRKLLQVSLFSVHCDNQIPSRYLLINRSLTNSKTLKKTFTIIDNDDFEKRVIHSTVPVIVNFHAEWCDPCKILTPKLEELVNASNGVDLAVVDVEKNPELVHTFEVKAVPAILAIRDGLVVDKFIGLVEAAMIEKLIRKISEN